MRIKTRFTLQFIMVVTLIILTAFGVIYVSSATYRENELYRRLDNKAQTCAELFVSVDQIDSTMLRLFDLTQKDKLPRENISIYDDQNREVYTNNDSVDFAITPGLLREVRDAGNKRFSRGEIEILGKVYESGSHQFVVFAGAYDMYGLRKLWNLRNTLLVLFTGILTIVAVAGWVFAGRALKPLITVIDDVNALDLRRLEMRLPETVNKDEIGELISTFNMLLTRIENAFNLQRLFINGASHELKNPLTAITSQLQVALLNKRSEQEYRELMASILDDIRLMNRTANNLMEFARLTHEKEVGLESVRIDDVIWEVTGNFRKNEPGYKVEVIMNDLPDDQNRLIIPGHASLLGVALANIVDNACKFSPDQACTLSLQTNEGSFRITVSDNGPGIPESQLPYIFEPFYRGKMKTGHKGHGIGLALSQKILQLHNAKLSVETRVGHGTVFSMDIPWR